MGKINKELAINKGLIINDDTSKYDKLVKIYKYLLEYFINSKLDLYKYDELINNNNLHIGINDKFKELNEYLKFDYIFLVNELFVEKLSLDDINTLLTKFNYENISNECIDVVSRTYKDVIYNNFIKGEYQNIIYKVNYGPMVPSFMVDNDSLVIEIGYGKNTIDLDEEKYYELNNEQLAFLNKIGDEIKEKVKNKLNTKCAILIEKKLF